MNCQETVSQYASEWDKQTGERARTVNLAFCLGANLFKCSHGEINGVAIVAGWAIVGNRNSHRFAVRSVGDLDLLTAQRRFVARVAVAVLI